MPRFFTVRRGDFCQFGAAVQKIKPPFTWMGSFLYVSLQVGSQDMPSELFFIFTK